MMKSVKGLVIGGVVLLSVGAIGSVVAPMFQMYSVNQPVNQEGQRPQDQEWGCDMPGRLEDGFIQGQSPNQLTQEELEAAVQEQAKGLEITPTKLYTFENGPVLLLASDKDQTVALYQVSPKDQSLKKVDETLVEDGKAKAEAFLKENENIGTIGDELQASNITGFEIKQDDQVVGLLFVTGEDVTYFGSDGLTVSNFEK